MSKKYRYIKCVDDNGYEDYYEGNPQVGIQFSSDIENATDITELSETDVQTLLVKIKRDYRSDENIFILNVEESPVDLEGEFLEITQVIALEKLSECEIKALGLEKLAVYLKLKYHNVPEVEGQ